MHTLSIHLSLHVSDLFKLHTIIVMIMIRLLLLLTLLSMQDSMAAPVLYTDTDSMESGHRRTMPTFDYL